MEQSKPFSLRHSYDECFEQYDNDQYIESHQNHSKDNHINNQTDAFSNNCLITEQPELLNNNANIWLDSDANNISNSNQKSMRHNVLDVVKLFKHHPMKKYHNKSKLSVPYKISIGEITHWSDSDDCNDDEMIDTYNYSQCKVCNKKMDSDELKRCIEDHSEEKCQKCNHYYLEEVNEYECKDYFKHLWVMNEIDLTQRCSSITTNNSSFTTQQIQTSSDSSSLSSLSIMKKPKINEKRKRSDKEEMDATDDEDDDDDNDEDQDVLIRKKSTKSQGMNLRKRVLCKLCDKYFGSNESLSVHIDKVHSKDIANNIVQNEKKHNLKDEEECDENEWRFYCDECNKGFKQKGNLKTHMRVHSGEKPFKCNLCHKRFRQKGHLDQHKRVHLGIKPYKCNRCNRQFSQLCHLQSHLEKHHGISRGPKRRYRRKK